MKNIVKTAIPCAALTLLLGACGGSAESAEGGSGMPAACQQPPFEFEIRRNGTGPNEVFTAVSARADMQLELRSYKLY